MHSDKTRKYAMSESIILYKPYNYYDIVGNKVIIKACILDSEIPYVSQNEANTEYTHVLSGEGRGGGILSGERCGSGSHWGEWRGGSVHSGTRGKVTAVSRAGRENSKTDARR